MDKINKISRENAEHYNWKEVCDGWHLVKHDDLSIITETMPPKTSEDMHYHTKANQFFYILSGEAEMVFEDGKTLLKANEGIEIQKGVWHQMTNSGDKEVSFLVVSSPKSHGDRVTK